MKTSPPKLNRFQRKLSSAKPVATPARTARANLATPANFAVGKTNDNRVPRPEPAPGLSGIAPEPSRGSLVTLSERNCMNLQSVLQEHAEYVAERLERTASLLRENDCDKPAELHVAGARLAAQSLRNLADQIDKTVDQALALDIRMMHSEANSL